MKDAKQQQQGKETAMSYQPIENYGMIGDLRTIALVSIEGSIDFMCFPHYDSPTLFGAMLDQEKGGKFQISPAVSGARLRQLYIPDTNVLISRFLSPDGVAEVIDFMPVGEVRHTHTIVRRVQCVRGPFTVRVHCAPGFDYARRKHRIEERPGEILFIPEGDGLEVLRLRTPKKLKVVGGAAVAELTLEANETVDFVLEIVRGGQESPTSAPDYVETALQHTIDFWRNWVNRSRYKGRWREMVNRSALVMKLLCSQSTGAIAAAATFGLPEGVGGERNWDYRFTWIRDGSLTAATLISLGFTDEADRFVRWIQDRYLDSQDGSLQIMYGIDGRRELTEEILEHLAGYRGSRPVRIGNGAYHQLQLDIYGELLYLMEMFDREVEPVSFDLWTQLSRSIEWLSENWQRTDEGIWEVRGGQHEFLYSRMMAWVAFERAGRIAQRRSMPAPLLRWHDTRDAIYNEIYHQYWDDTQQVFVQYKGGKSLDASTLLMPMVGLISPRDPRWRGTLDAIERDLVNDSLVYRYRIGDSSDGLSGTEGTFAMCSYWYVECLARAGELRKARYIFEKLHGYANHLGLYSEEMDSTGGYLGNFPQAFTHLGLVNAACYLNEALDQAGEA